MATRAVRARELAALERAAAAAAAAEPRPDSCDATRASREREIAKKAGVWGRKPSR
jgi:hypothetical protein